MDEKKAGDQNFTLWLASNIGNVRAGLASFEGERVTMQSEVARYYTCFSIVFFTMKTTTPYFLVGTDAQQRSAVTATAITSLLGWWGIPFGLIFTPYCLFVNLKGGDRRTVESLIADLENPAKATNSDKSSYLPLKIIGIAFAVILATACAIQSYVWLTGKGHKFDEQTQASTHTSAAMNGKAPAAVSPKSLDPTSLYMARMQRRLKRAWFPPKSNESSSVKVRFKIDKDGNVLDPKVLGTVDPAQARAALQAIKDACPLPPLPTVLRPDVDIEFTFDYMSSNSPVTHQ